MSGGPENKNVGPDGKPLERPLDDAGRRKFLGQWGATIIILGIAVIGWCVLSFVNWYQHTTPSVVVYASQDEVFAVSRPEYCFAFPVLRSPNPPIMFACVIARPQSPKSQIANQKSAIHHTVLRW